MLIILFGFGAGGIFALNFFTSWQLCHGNKLFFLFTTEQVIIISEAQLNNI